MSYVLGIDKGTTTTKAAIFNTADGRVLATARRPTKSFRPHPDWHEEDMDGTYAGVAAAIREAIDRAGIAASEIAAVGVSGHMGGLWSLDAQGRPAGPAIAWPDARASALLERWRDECRVKKLFEISGNAPIPGLPLVLLAWLKDNDRSFYNRIETVFLAKDYVNYRLTGNIATDESDLSLFPCDIRSRKPSDDLFALAGIPEMREKLAPVLEIGAVVGRVTAVAAAETGLTEGTLVVTGAGDAVAAAIGVGALASGQAVTVIGTSFMNNLTVDQPLLEPEGVGFLFLMPDGRWQRLMSNTGGGSLCLDWIVEAFGAKAFGGDDDLFTRIETEARAIAPLSNGLVIHPYFNTSGMTAPRHEPLARGSIFGLDMATSPMALIRAVMEGVAFSMIDCYGALNAPVDTICITGGGARSPLWREICAAAMNRTLLVPEAEETGALGVALLAARAAGFYDSLTAAAAAMVRIAATVEPDPQLAVRYAAAYPLFRDLGRDLAPLWKLRAALLERTDHTKDAP
ncbi:sugar (pentulose or hexulose) kinase [Pararhizobium capsulatum DSM 1112]|uniref:Sugar (Pentulose or hexulose) kinase n=1 Tax=Pararhizobium capsulatum DSM 1112 TaxID=1121113 RepID=A0ABU0BYE8_9HYPH|nr:FGGY-family carbohydrate kinase [Pararhizobium capsulatum]MDQ0323275.1 sugar (pentulose or hexulose) kinase [Pararhizobium capsulatum DSM 1112]